jgi:hypothetical protein
MANYFATNLATARRRMPPLSPTGLPQLPNSNMGMPSLPSGVMSSDMGMTPTGMTALANPVPTNLPQWFSGDGKMTPLGPTMPPPNPAPGANPGAPGLPMWQMPTNLYPSYAPTMADVTKRLDAPITFDPLRSDGVVDPALQAVLDRIKQSTSEGMTEGTSMAQALASRRGLAGSSIEQFGTSQAVLAAQKAARDAETSVYLKGFDSDLQKQMLAAQLKNSNGQLASNLTSDELASLRNADFSQRQIDLQKYLGDQGIALGRENIQASSDIANKQAQYGMISAGLGALLPGLLGGGGGGIFGGGAGGGGGLGNLLGLGGGGGGLSGLFGGGATPFGQYLGGISGAGPGGIPLASAGGGYGLGGFGMGAGALAGGAGLGLLGGMAGNAAFGGGNDLGAFLGGGAGMFFGGPVGAGVGAFLGTAAQRLGGKAYSSLQGSLGNTAASVLKPFVNPIGTIADIAKNPGKAVNSAVSSVTKSIGSVFPF